MCIRDRWPISTASWPGVSPFLTSASARRWFLAMPSPYASGTTCHGSCPQADLKTELRRPCAQPQSRSMTESGEKLMEPDRRPLNPTASLHAALAAAPPLRWPSPERDRLWLAVQDAVCTRARAWACAMGSTTPQEVGGEDARHV